MKTPKPKILVVDDEPLIQSVTKSSLRRYKFNGEDVEIISALSAEEGRKLFEEHPDISVILLDVVMEYETAGLDFSRWVRDHQRPEQPIILRTAQGERGYIFEKPIILRTGQAGQFLMPSQILQEYPVNDYREKVDLANPKSLQNILTSSLITWALQEVCRHVDETETRSGWDFLIDVGRISGSFFFAEPVDEAIRTKFPLSLASACSLALHMNTARRLRVPLEDKTNETEAKPSPFVVIDQDGTLQFLCSYQPNHSRRTIVETDAQRVDQPYLAQLKSEQWEIQPWWTLKSPGNHAGDYALWCTLKKV